MARAARLQQLVLTELRSQSLFADREAIKLLTSLCQADGSIDPVHKLLQQLDFNSIGAWLCVGYMVLYGSTTTSHFYISHPMCDHPHPGHRPPGDGKLTKAAIEDQLENSASTSSDEHLIQVIDARTVPRICYDPIRKTFYLDPSPAQLHADAKVMFVMCAFQCVSCGVRLSAFQCVSCVVRLSALQIIHAHAYHHAIFTPSPPHHHINRQRSSSTISDC